MIAGALLCKPFDSNCDFGVIFFNNTGYLGMCGHGTIGVAITLKHLEVLASKTLPLETPVGIVTGDVAWGGNWFFLINKSPLPLFFENEKALTAAAAQIKESLIRNEDDPFRNGIG